MDSPPDSGALLRALREAAGLSRAQLARFAGLSETTIRNIECERHPPTARLLARLRAVLQTLSVRA